MAQRLADHSEPPARPLPAGGPGDGVAAERGLTAARLRPWLTYPAWGTLLATLLFARLFPAAARHWQFVPFLLGLVFLGLPHGALDHLAPFWVKHRRPAPAPLLLLAAGYLACGGAYLLFWRVCPPAALGVFLLLSWLHWGQGDSYFLEVFGGRPAASGAERLVRWLVRGGLPIVLPILAFPQTFSQFSGGLLGWYGGGVWHLGAPLRLAGMAALAGLLTAYLRQSRRGRRTGVRGDAGEVGLLLIYFALTPPILAVGVYFCVWHSARHLARLLLLDDASRPALARGEWAGPLRRLAWQAAPMTLGALALLGGLAALQGRLPASAADVVWLSLSLIAALTFPHFLLVSWMDRQEKALAKSPDLC